MIVAQGRSCPSCHTVVGSGHPDCPACGERVPFDAPLLSLRPATDGELRARFPGPDLRATRLRMGIALALLLVAAVAGAISADGVLLTVAAPFAAVLFGIGYTGYRLRHPGPPRFSPADRTNPRDAAEWVRDGPITRWGRIWREPEAKAGKAFTPFAVFALCTAPGLVPILEAAARVSRDEVLTVWHTAASILVLAAGVIASAAYGQWYDATTVARYRYPD
jgi:hypothetical protein